MSIPVIHFSTLADLLGDFGYAGAMVRVSISQRTVTRTVQGFPTKTRTVTVCVTAMTGCILSHIPFAQAIEFSAMTRDDNLRTRYDQAWQTAERIAEEVRAAIRLAGHEPYPGRFDLFDAEPVEGQAWKLQVEAAEAERLRIEKARRDRDEKLRFEQEFPSRVTERWEPSSEGDWDGEDEEGKVATNENNSR